MSEIKLRIVPMDADSAKALIRWQYAAPYDIYNIDINEEELAAEIAHFTDPANHYYAIFDAEDSSLIGHCVFHDEARVPGGDYRADALDIGIGMRPDWTGQGNGTAISEAVIDFGIDRYAPQRLRATIADFNARSQKVTTNNGFEIVSSFEHPKTGKRFHILMRDA